MLLERCVGRSDSPRRMASGILLFALALSIGTAVRPFASADPATLSPEVGRLLVARAGLPDPNFFESVVLLLDYAEDAGAVGVVLNRRTGLAVGHAVPPEVGLADRDDRLYLGGPVSLDTLIVLMTEEEAPRAASPILPGVVVVRSGEGLDQLMEGDPAPPSVRFFAGYAGWAPGQLEDEIARGVWKLLPGDSRWVFTDRPDETWRRLTDILFGPKT